MKDDKENMPLVDRVTIVAEVYIAVGQLQLFFCFETPRWRHKSSVVTKHI